MHNNRKTPPYTFLTRVELVWPAALVPVISVWLVSSSGGLSSVVTLLSSGSPFSKASRLLPSKGANTSFFNPSSISALGRRFSQFNLVVFNSHDMFDGSLRSIQIVMCQAELYSNTSFEWRKNQSRILWRMGSSFLPPASCRICVQLSWCSTFKTNIIEHVFDCMLLEKGDKTKWVGLILNLHFYVSFPSRCSNCFEPLQSGSPGRAWGYSSQHTAGHYNCDTVPKHLYNTVLQACGPTNNTE